MSRYILTILLILSGYSLTAQVYNPIPQYVFRNKLGVGRSTPVDSAAYMNIGPNGGANQGVVLPRVADTLSILGTKRHGLLIFSRQLDKFAWWDSTGGRWTEVGSGSGGSSGGEVMLMNGSSTVGDSLLQVSVSGDTAFIKNLLAGADFTITPQGDTVLELNAKNIGNSDLSVPVDVSRMLSLKPGANFKIGDSALLEDENEALISLDKSSVQISVGSDNYGRINLDDSSYSLSSQSPSGFTQIESTDNASISIITSNVLLELSNLISLEVNGIIIESSRKPIQISGNPVIINSILKQSSRFFNGSVATNQIDSTYSIYVLGDLTGDATSRSLNLSLPVGYEPLDMDGVTIEVINQNSDATYKWSFSGVTVYDKNGSTVTTLDDLTAYTLIYLNTHSEYGAGWHIIKKY